MKRLACLVVVVVLLAACGPVPALPLAVGDEDAGAIPSPTETLSPRPGLLYVDATQSTGAVSPLLFGTNVGPWMGVPFELQDEVAAAGITFLRFPGGAFGDENDLKPYQIDQFIEFARGLGAEPAISVRLRGGTPEEAAELVRYANLERGYSVRYWSIGNEPTLYGDDYTTGIYNKEWRAFADAMEAVDPSIVLVGPDIHQYTANPANDLRDGEGREWMSAFLEANGDRVDIVSFHRYPFPTSRTGGPPTIEELRANAPEWDSIVPRLRALIHETTDRDLPIAVTEVNSNWTHAASGEATPDSLFNAIWWGDVLGRMMRNDVEIVAHFALQAPRGSGWGMMDRSTLRPLYYVYRLYQQFGSERLVTISPEPALSIYAARRADGALTIMVVNLGDEPRSVPLEIKGYAGNSTAQLFRLDIAHNGELAGTEEIGGGAELALPPHSITLYVLPGK